MEIACSSTSGCSSLHSVVISMPFPPVPSLKNTYRVSYSSGEATLKAGVRLSPPLLLPRVPPPPPLNFRNMAASILHNMLRGKARAESERASSQGSQQQLPELESDDDVSEEDIGDAFELPQEEEEAELVEELEGLEEEAMTGEDDGREPNDYDRRAHIFDESSRVFQALKDRERPPP